MGNHHSHGGASGNGKKTNGQSAPSHHSRDVQDGTSKGLSRTSSGADLHDKAHSQMLPVEKLAEILAEKSREEEGINGVALNTFTRYLFPRYPIFAEKLYGYLHAQCKSKTGYVGTTAFKQQCEKFLGILDDDTARDVLVKMYSKHTDGGDVITPDLMRSLLMSTYHVTMDHYSEGPQMCLSINKTLKSVVDSCFHTKEQLSTSFVSHWIEANCPRLLVPLHRYAVHSLATSWRTLEAGGPPLAAGLELATPVLEQPPPFSGSQSKPHPHLLQMSMSWLLAAALSPVFSRPQRAHSPSNSAVGLASKAFMSKLLCSIPSHWILLYDSNEMGLGSNRFLHHVLAYKGPTLCLIRDDGGAVYCVAAPNEWRESHLYWGSEEAAVFQLLPKYLMLEKGAKMLYLNTTVRGYPQGLRAGKDPRNPIISIDGGFEKMEFRKIPYAVDCIEVWGCGDQASRDRQLDIRKWEVKEAERQRCVKISAADWKDHPDRYLLQLAGINPEYNDQNNQS